MPNKDLDYQLGIVVGKLEEHDKILNRIDTTLYKNTDILAEHVRRTDLAEANIELLRKSLAPIEGHVEFMRRLARASVAVLAFIGSFLAVMKGIKGFKW